MKRYCHICDFKADVTAGNQRRAVCKKYGDRMIKLYQTCDSFAPKIKIKVPVNPHW